jgi:hypothetical protein
MSGSSSRALVHSSRVSRAPAGPALMAGLPSLGFPPSSRRHSAESTPAGVPSPLRSALDVSHVLDGLLLCQTLRVCFAPQPRPGFALQGFPLARSRTGSSPAVALVSFTLSPCSRLPDSSRTPRPPSGPCSACQSVAEHSGLDRALLAPLVSFSLPRVFLHTPWSNFHRPSDHGLSRSPSYQQRVTWPALASLPSPSKVPGLQLRADLRRHFATRPHLPSDPLRPPNHPTPDCLCRPRTNSGGFASG